MLSPPPPIQLLEAVRSTIAAVDYQALAGIAGVTIRHTRNRRAVKGERPCISIIWTSDDARQGDELDHNNWERVRELGFDLQADLDLPSEASGEDVTGWLGLSLMLAAAMQALTVIGGPMSMICDDVRTGALNPDEQSDPDNGRLVRNASILYRVRVDDENVLLAAGENV